VTIDYWAVTSLYVYEISAQTYTIPVAWETFYQLHLVNPTLKIQSANYRNPHNDKHANYAIISLLNTNTINVNELTENSKDINTGRSQTKLTLTVTLTLTDTVTLTLTQTLNLPLTLLNPNMYAHFADTHYKVMPDL